MAGSILIEITEAQAPVLAGVLLANVFKDLPAPLAAVCCAALLGGDQAARDRCGQRLLACLEEQKPKSKGAALVDLTQAQDCVRIFLAVQTAFHNRDQQSRAE